MPPEQRQSGLAAREEPLGRNAIGALATFAQGGRNLQAHFPLDGSAQETAHQMGLSAGGLGEFRERCTVRPPHQVRDELAVYIQYRFFIQESAAPPMSYHRAGKRPRRRPPRRP